VIAGIPADGKSAYVIHSLIDIAMRGQTRPKIINDGPGEIRYEYLGKTFPDEIPVTEMRFTVIVKQD
jgi:hypothetical protein